MQGTSAKTINILYKLDSLVAAPANLKMRL